MRKSKLKATIKELHSRLALAQSDLLELESVRDDNLLEFHETSRLFREDLAHTRKALAGAEGALREAREKARVTGETNRLQERLRESEALSNDRWQMLENEQVRSDNWRAACVAVVASILDSHGVCYHGQWSRFGMVAGTDADKIVTEASKKRRDTIEAEKVAKP